MKLTRYTTIALTVGLMLATARPGEASPARTLEICQRKAQSFATKYVKRRITAIRRCVDKIANRLIVRGDADAEAAARSCVTALSRIENDDPSRTFEAKMHAAISKACDPAVSPNLEHTAADVLEAGAGPPLQLNANRLGSWCAWFGGDGVVDSVSEWIDCIAAANACAAHAALSVDYPRLLEWLDLLRPSIAALDPTPTAALMALDEINSAIEGSVDDDIPEIRCGASLFPASAQQTVYNADKNADPGATVEDDGTLQIGSALRFQDNGDGTIIDLNTRLQWEKKVAGDGVADSGNLHDADNGYRWSDELAFGEDTIWDFLDDLNAEGGTGFAGHDDWRIPNVKELQSIVDYERNMPSVDPAMHDSAGCGAACTDLTDATCSCTDSLDYWTSTTRSFNPLQAWAVDFHSGGTTQRAKTSSNRVRAVRGGL